MLFNHFETLLKNAEQTAGELGGSEKFLALCSDGMPIY